MKKLLAAALALCALAAAPVQAKPQRAIPSAVPAYLDQLGKDGFSGTILVARHGQVLTRSYGMADREWAIPNAADTKFKIGSLTKQFTAMGMLLLVKDGKLGLDDSVCRYVTPCSAAWQPIVIRQLLNHSSGIPDFVRLPELQGHFNESWPLARTIALLESKPLDFAPGSSAHYGNSGLLLSAYIIEKLSGQSYADFLTAHIYRPLGMTASGYAADEPILTHRAHGYARKNGEVQNAAFLDMSIPIGAGSQYSTVGDLYRWDRALYTDALLPKALRDQMFAAGKGDFGLGWEIDRSRGRLAIEHIGDINGFGAFIARWPDEDATAIILTNMQGTKVRDIRNAIEDRLFAKR